MAITADTSTLTALYEAWSAPFLADPSDDAAMTARGVQARELAAAILSAPLTAKAGALSIASAGWSFAAAAAARKAGEVGTPAWRAAIGPHEHATLTSDSQYIGDGFCRCDPEPAITTWVRYEKWTAAGCGGHGFACPSCRRITQTG
jgi:hypothetical protein